MDKNYLKKILETKTKSELQRLSIDLDVDYKGLTKKNLVANILLVPKKLLKRHIPELQKKSITKSVYFKIVLVVIPILITLITAKYCSLNKEDVKVAVNESNEDFEKLYLENEDYKKKIEEYKSLNSIFLEKLLPFGYYVFGYRNENLVIINEYIRDSSILNIDEIFIILNVKEKYGEIIYMNLSEFRLFDIGIHGKQNSLQNGPFYLGEMGEFSRIPSLYILDIGLYIVMLNNDIYNPVFALGFGNADYLDNYQFDPY